MSAFILRRLIQTIVVILIVSILIFLIVRLLPGDPALLYVSEDQLRDFTPEQIQAIRHQLGLDAPLAVQYLNWLGGLFHGDLGQSLVQRMSVWDLISTRMPITAYLAGIAFIVSTVIGIPLGIIAAIRRGEWIDTLATLIANLGITVPVFWLGILGIYFFSLYLRWLPTFGFTPPTDNLMLSLKQTIMPVACLSVFAIGSYARQMRSSLLEVIQQDYVRTAWAKGLKERTVIIRHVLKNSLIPVVTLMGISLRNVVGGAVIIETVFSIPGMGRLAVDAILSKDYAVVQGVVLIIAIIVCLANLVVDLAYGWIDPRIRLSQ